MDQDARVTDVMISAKREFHRQAQEVKTPSKVLFSDKEAQADGYEEVTIPLLPPFKPSVDIGSPGMQARAFGGRKPVRHDS
jgi:hypothetical protein